MKAVVAHGPNQPWSVTDVPMARPDAGQVLIRVHASGVCFNDLRQGHGTPGHEPAGEIVALGAGVRTRKVGDRVGAMLWQTTCGRCEWCQRGKPLYCRESIGTSLQMPGSHAEYMIAYEEGTVLLPDALSFEQAAPIFCAGYTAYAGLRAADPQPGERVAVVGIGGLGHMAVQYAKAAGFETIAVSHSPDKTPTMRELGADGIVADGTELAAAGGADVILATSSSMSAQADAIQGLRPEGRMAVMGMASTPLAVPVGPLIMKRARIIGSQHNNREHLYEALALAARGKVKVVTETYHLSDAEKARERLSQGRVRFRAVLVD